MEKNVAPAAVVAQQTCLFCLNSYVSHMNTFFSQTKYNQGENSILNSAMEISHITIHSGTANIGNCKWLLFNSELKCTEESVISIFNAPLVFPWCDFTFIYESWDSKSEDILNSDFA